MPRLLTAAVIWIPLSIGGAGCILDWMKYKPIEDASIPGDVDVDLDVDVEPDADADVDVDGDADVDADVEPDVEIDDDSDIPSLVFVEQDGLVVVEAEHFSENLSGDTGYGWYLTDETIDPTVIPDPDSNHASSAGNGAYMEGLPDLCYYETDIACTEDPFIPEAGTGPTLNYRIDISTTGQYYLFLRFYIRTKDNTVYAWIDENRENAIVMQMCGGPAWVWAREMRNPDDGECIAQEPLVISTQGEHSIHLSMREDGTELDRLILTTDRSLVVEGIGPLESSRRTR